MKKTLSLIILFFSFLLFFPRPTYALTFDLIAPAEALVRGEEVQFTINVDTEGTSLTSTSIGMTHDTQYLEFVSAAAGDTFTTISTDNQGNGRLILTGTKTDGFNGTGTFAVVTFNLIADAAGSTQLCTLFNPATAAPTPTTAPGATSAPIPTSLPTSGTFDKTAKGALLGIFFFGLSLAGFVIFKKI